MSLAVGSPSGLPFKTFESNRSTTTCPPATPRLPRRIAVGYMNQTPSSPRRRKCRGRGLATYKTGLRLGGAGEGRMARLPTKKKGLAVIQVTVVAAADRERIIAIVRDHKAAEGAEILTGLDPVTFSVNFTEYNPATVFALMEAIKDLRGVADVRSTLQKKSRFSLSLKTRRRLESGF